MTIRFLGGPKKQDVRADRELSITGTNVVPGKSPARVLRDGLGGALEIAQIRLGLIESEALERIVPDVFDVAPGLRRQLETSHWVSLGARPGLPLVLEKGVKVERQKARRSARLRSARPEASRDAFHVLPRAGVGADDVARRAITASSNLLFDEAGEVIAETD